MMEYTFNAKETKERIITWIREWFEENGKECNAVLGMSGGKDSTIAAALCVEALGKDRVIGVAMPDDSREQGLNDADKICEYLGIKFIIAPIGEAVKAVEKFATSDQSIQNIPPRIRMTTLYAISQSNNGRVVNTCNFSEDWVGYMTIYGDSAGDFSPLGNLTVTEILSIGDEMGLPREWVHKTPDDGLPNSNSDESKFGFTYETLDHYLRGTKKIEGEIAKKIDSMHTRNKFKLMPMATFQN